jgi:hypothetical protein
MTQMQKLRGQEARNDQPVNNFPEDVERAVDDRQSEERQCQGDD